MSAREYVCIFVNGQMVPMSELVRCHDCKHWNIDCHTQPDHHCADGVRRYKA